MTDSTPLLEIEDGVAWYFEGTDGASKTKHEGSVAVYPDWVRLGGLAIPTWVPRDRVEQVHER
jgi:hypothetical protein